MQQDLTFLTTTLHKSKTRNKGTIAKVSLPMGTPGFLSIILQGGCLATRSDLLVRLQPSTSSEAFLHQPPKQFPGLSSPPPSPFHLSAQHLPFSWAELALGRRARMGSGEGITHLLGRGLLIMKVAAGNPAEQSSPIPAEVNIGPSGHHWSREQAAGG